MRLGSIITLLRPNNSKKMTAKGEPTLKKVNTIPIAGKGMATVFGYTHGVILIEP